MHYFDLIDGALNAEGVALEHLAAEVGTPAYVYSTATFQRHYQVMREAADVSIHFTRSPLGAEFAGIFDACRREVARIERADRRLAHQVHA